MIAGDFSIQLSPIDRLSRQNLNREMLELNDVINQTDPTDIYGTFHLKTRKYNLFLEAHGTFPKINHILGHKASLNRYNKIERTP